MGVELPLRVVVTILESCVTFSGVKLSIRSFVLLLGLPFLNYLRQMWQVVALLCFLHYSRVRGFIGFCGNI